MNREAGVTEHSQRHSGGIFRRNSVDMHVKQRQMSCADKLDRTVVCSSSYDQSRELPGERAFAEDAVGVLHHSLAREAGFGEAPKCRMQLTHKHGRRYTLAGNVSKHEK